ncbi:putative vacuolar protein sorting protein [Talaromyces proteolyticus]|uniref:Vacuolar protein-sorting-associated protein 36 n=1 Tax=Talaromyces proteolyticus TaxID=1131652 RepID=A0AAD4KL45_9EURO|nr:putative vacuolar protein sorting protein [Talaromyces proteolyticus]KAH8690883.1 putative vacuolar protein sorting protein [Talaromyces proteolyticus]
MFFKPLDLTTALRPSLLPDETLLFVQDAVGLYEGKFKIPSYQNGHAYLTSHRICYVATDEPRKYSVSVELKDVDRAEYQAGFVLKSSPKITIFPKPQKPSLIQQHNTSQIAPSGQTLLATQPLSSRGASPAPKVVNATWVCPICSFSNTVPSNFDPTTATASTPLPPCLACGIKPPLATVLKATIAAATNRGSTNFAPAIQPAPSQQEQTNSVSTEPPKPGTTGIPLPCPRCTFLNHPSLLECEICGASLGPSSSKEGTTATIQRTESPAPFFNQSNITNREISDSIKLSFRGGGEKTFYERLKSCLIQRKWLLQNAPPVPQLSQSPHREAGSSPAPDRSGQSTPRPSAVGIAGLEQRGVESRKNNELVIGNAFEDLEALMASAKQIVSLAETLASESGVGGKGRSTEASAVLSESAAALNMVTTKDMLGSGAENLYLSELSRNLAEYLTDDRKGVLRKEGDIMSLIDLWALFNRTRNGVELVSPSDFQQAAELWDKLKLPVRLRRFKSGLLVVQPYDWSDEKIIQQLDEWLQELRMQTPSESSAWDWIRYGCGVTAQETAQHFGWSVGVAAEELEMAEDRGVLCREEGIEGVRFWRNYFLLGESMELEHKISLLAL